MIEAQGMENFGMLENMDYHAIALQAFKQDKEDVFKDLQGDKMDSLKGSIQDIQDLIELRKKLNKELFLDITQMKVDVGNFLNGMPQANTFHPEVVSQTMKLWQKQIDLEELRAKEKLDCFRDIADLKRELRERIQEFSEKESRASVLDKILE